jgi:glycosyltransferase involved in cell wall biosynthesis
LDCRRQLIETLVIGGAEDRALLPGDVLRITFILPGFLPSPSGGFKIVYEYTNRLQARGHHVTVVHPRNEEAQKGAAQFVKGRLWKYKLQLRHRPLIHWFKIHPDVELLLAPDLRERFIPDADAIVATAYDTSFHVDSYATTKGNKFYLIQSYETWNGPEERVRASWKLPLHKIVISRWLLRIARELGEEDRTSYIPLGLDLSQFKLITPVNERRIPRVGMLSHPNKIKGTKDGLTALETAKEKFPALQAALFGTDPRPPDLPGWIEYVHQPSPERLLSLYNSCQVFLHPSWIEGWGLPAAEAMACGCVLVAAANEGVYEFAVDGVNALLAPIKQPAALAQKLMEALAQDDLRARLAEAGRARIQLLSWDRAVESIERLLTAGRDR